MSVRITCIKKDNGYHENPHVAIESMSWINETTQKTGSKRARLTVYNAQESDTFGKDSEAGVTLAQAKPVVVFVARLFDQEAELQSIYAAIDEAARLQRDDFVKLLQDKKLVGTDEAQTLLGPEKTKGDAIELIIHKHGQAILEKLGEELVGMELIRQG